MVTTILRVEVDETARRAGRLSPDTVQLARRAVLNEGIVVLEKAISAPPLTELDARMAADLDVLRRRPDAPENFAYGHLQQDPPPWPDLIFPEIIASPFAAQVCRAVLGQVFRITSYSANSNIPGSESQAVHVDEGQCWPDLPIAHPPARLVVNVPLTDTDARGGAIEVWPGTHLDTSVTRYATSEEERHALALDYLRASRRAKVSDRVNRRVGLTVARPQLDQRRKERPPAAVETMAGSIIIRDPRVWHRGTPNRRERTRFMVSMTYDPQWREGGTIEFPSIARPVVESLGIHVSARYVDGDIDYLGRHRPPEASPLRRATSPLRRALPTESEGMSSDEA